MGSFFHNTVKGRVVQRFHNQWRYVFDTYIITLVFQWYMLIYVEATFSQMYSRLLRPIVRSFQSVLQSTVFHSCLKQQSISMSS